MTQAEIDLTDLPVRRWLEDKTAAASPEVRYAYMVAGRQGTDDNGTYVYSNWLVPPAPHSAQATYFTNAAGEVSWLNSTTNDGAALVEAIRKDKVQKVRIVAYTDNKGSVRYNQQLSMRRAESIKKRLANTGADNIEVSGAGEIPSDDGATGEKARRAEIMLVK